MRMDNLGKMLIMVGLLIAAMGGLLWLGGRIPGLGRLPGDIMIRKGNFTFYLPLATSLLLSLLISAVLWLFSRR